MFFIIGGIITSILNETLSMIFYLAVLLPTIAVTSRRLHDTDRSGWYQLIGLIPVIGLILLYFLSQKGKAPNRFGKEITSSIKSSTENKNDHNGISLPPQCNQCNKEKTLLKKEEEQNNNENTQNNIFINFDSVIKYFLKNTYKPDIIVYNLKNFYPDKPDFLWEELLKRINIDDIITDLIYFFNNSMEFSQNEKNDIILFFNNQLVKDFFDNLFSDKYQKHIRNETEKYVNCIIKNKMSNSSFIKDLKTSSNDINLVKKEDNNAYTLIKNLFILFRFEDNSKHVIENMINIIKEQSNYSNEWLSNFQNEFDISEVVKLAFPLIKSIFSDNDLQNLYNYSIQYKTVIKKFNENFASPEYLKNADLLIDKYIGTIIQEINKDIK